MLVGSIELTSPTWRGFQYLQNSSKILFWIILEGGGEPCPKAALLFLLTVPPLSLYSLPSLISNSLNLLLELRVGRSRRLNEAYFL